MDGASIGPGYPLLRALHRISPLPDPAADELGDLLRPLVRFLERALPDDEVEVVGRDRRELARRLAAALGPHSSADEPQATAPLPQAEAVVHDLLAAERPEGLLRHDRRFESPLPARLLIRRARAMGSVDALEALRAAELAVRVAGRVDPAIWGAEAVIAVGCEARAARVEALLHLGDLGGAAGEVRELLVEADERIGARLRGDLHLLGAHVARRCGEIEEAAGLLMAARDLYERLGDDPRLGRALLQLGEVYREYGQVDLAVESARRGTACFEQTGDREAERYARHNLAIYLCDAGRPFESRAELERSRMLWGDEVEPYVRASSWWVEGRIHEEIGDVSRAEGLYRRVRKELLELGAVGEAVRVGLDLVGLWVENERYAEAERGARWLEVLLGEEPDLAEVRVELVGFRDGLGEGETPGELLRRLGSVRRLLPGR